MAYIQSQKGQNWLLPPNIEEIITEDHVCYLVESLVEALDFTNFDERYAGPGHPAYHPRIILKILVMGVLDKVRSSRKLARAVRENVVYMYLTEKTAPDFHTICDFRKDNPELVKNVFRHTVMLAKQQGLLDFSHLSTDGTKVKANAANKRVLTKDELLFLMRFVDHELEEWTVQDKKEDEIFGDRRGSDQLPEGSKKKIQRAVKHYIKKFKEKGDLFKEEIAEKLQRAHQEIEVNRLRKVNTTDPESRFMKNKKGKIEFSYNPQITTDKQGFILANDVCQDSDDREQLRPQVLQTEENIGALPEQVPWSFDNGYYNGKNLAFLETKKIDGYITNNLLAQAQKGKQVRKSYVDSLEYDAKNDMYLTPEGKQFTFANEYFDKTKNKTIRNYVLRENGKVVRTIKGYPYPVERRNMANKMRTPQAKETYKLRARTVEPVIGDIKQNKGLREFLTRSLETVKTEFNLACVACNIQKLWGYIHGKGVANGSFSLVDNQIKFSVY